MNKTSKMIQFTLIIVFIDIGILVQVNGNHFTNKFAVHIHGGERVAREIAAAHGYVHLGQIGSLEDHYLFEHPHVHRRSAARSQVHHEKLSSHPQIHWFEQQRLVSRKKRDFQPIPADVLLSESLKESSSSRHPRDADTDLHFNDPLYNKMWYFNGGGLNHTDMNVKGAWKKGVTGKNVVITILDDGIEREHDDLKDNYDPYASYDVNNHDSDPTPRYDYTNENRHGTRCAGEVSAKANNSVCVVGVAYDSKIGGVRMLDGDVYDAVEATSLSHNRSHIDIYSASWGPDDDGRVVDGPGQLAKKAFIDGVNMGRNGKGSIFVWASGNGGNQKDSCNCDGYTNSIYTLSISSISQQGKRPWYLEECSSTLATTYSSGTYAEKQIGRNGKGAIFMWASGNGGRTHDSCSCDGYTNSIYTLSISGISQHMQKPFYLEECASTLATTFSSGGGAERKVVTVDLRNKCTETHTGTSASAPLAAGIVALILEVRPSLTWRDVQYITLMTARPLPDGVWTTNAVGRKVSLRYGYGLMDATAMVELAEKWTNVPAQHICTVQSGNVGNGKPKLEIPDSGYEEVLGTDACAGKDNAINFLEHVQAKITLKSKRRGDLVIHLTSPSGTRSTILPQRPNDSDRMKGFDNWAFLSVHFWGENPVGNWKLEIEIVKNPNAYAGSSYGAYQASNDLIDWSLILYGTDANPVNLVSPDRPSKTPPTAPSAAGCHVQCKDGCSGPHADQCNNCKNYIIKETRMCVEVCPNNYYAQDQECHPCSESCETCTSITEQQVMCLKCKPGYLLVEGKGTCEQQCDKGYYKIEANHHCRVCSGMCAECEGSSGHCTACRDGFLLHGNTCVQKPEPCQAGQYSAEDLTCRPCPEGCFSCTSDTNCTCCNKGSYLQKGSCVNSCDSGFQPIHVNYSSKFVFQQCQHCGDQCNVCPEGFNYVKGVCLQQNNCPEGTFFQWNSMSCKSCSASCRACIGPSNTDCLACYPPRGYNNIMRQCMRCCSNGQLRLASKTCCKCTDDGKCDLSAAPPVNSDQAKQLFSVATLIVVLLVIVIGCLSIFVIVAIVIGCKKKMSHPDVSYIKLEQKDQDFEA